MFDRRLINSSPALRRQWEEFFARVIEQITSLLNAFVVEAPGIAPVKWWLFAVEAPGIARGYGGRQTS